MVSARIGLLDLGPALDVLERARRLDRAVLRLGYGGSRLDHVVIGLVRASPMGAVAWWEDEPVAALGIMVPGGTIGFGWMLATDRWRRVARLVTVWITDELMGACRRFGLTRVETRVATDRGPARAWMRRLGGSLECICPGCGPEGEVHEQWAWTDQAKSEV